MYHLLANLAEAGVLGQVRNVSVHFAVHLDVLDHVLAVSLQPAVEVVQVLDARYRTSRSIEELGRESLRERVVTLLLVPRHEVVSVFLNHPVEFRNLVGAVLKVGIHGDDHIALRLLESAEQGWRLAVVAAELDALCLFVLGSQFFYHLPRAVGASVVHENHFVAVAVLVHYPLNPGKEFRQGLFFII